MKHLIGIALLISVLGGFAAWNHYRSSQETVQAPPAFIEQTLLVSKASVKKETGPAEAKPVATSRQIKSIPVLMYHKVSPDPKVASIGYRIEPEEFEWQMRYLYENGYHSIDLGMVVDYFLKGVPIPEKPIVITLDDGYQDNFLYAYPIMKKFNFTGTIFVVSNIIGGVNEFDIKARLQPENKMMSWEQIKELDANGFIIGCHTLDHAHLARVSRDEARRQIAQSKRALEEGLSKEVQYFCYPYGEYNSFTLQVVKESGFKAAVTVNPQPVTGVKDPLRLNRLGVPGYIEHEEFIKMLSR